jgi:hypothetical protein
VEPFNVDLNTTSLGNPSVSPPDDYLKYCEPSSQLFLPPSSERVEEFKKKLLDLSLTADDVAGINEVRSSTVLFAFSYRVTNLCHFVT